MPGNEPAFLSNIWCTGTETSLLGCSSYGYRVLNIPDCKDHVGVYCWKNGNIYLIFFFIKAKVNAVRI